MRRLLLMRHAKSSWDRPGLRDFDRPLSPRGEKAAVSMGQHILDDGLVPDLVFCSPAKRTRQTLNLTCAQFGTSPQIMFDDSLYGGTISFLQDLLRSITDDNVRTAMIIGHNPETQGLALNLSRDAGTDAMAALKSKYPTAGLAIIEFGISTWAEVQAGQGTLIDFTSPKRLGRG